MSALDDADTGYAALERGEALLGVGRPREALAELRRATAADPSDALAHCLTALAHVQLDEHGEALAAAERATGLAPELGWPHRVRSVALGKLGRKREAREAALEAVRCDPEEAMGYVVLSDALQETGDEAGALHAARHAIELAPEDPDAHNQLGLVLLEHDRAAEGAEAFRTALSLDAEHDLALNNLAVARLRMGERDAALTEFEAAARLDPRSDVVRQNVLALGGRARVYRRFAIAFGIAGLLALTASVVLGLVLLAVAAVFEVVRRGSLSELTAPTRALVLDDARARRFKPQRWDWSWPTRLRPWWWLLLMQIPPPIALVLNAVALAAALAWRNGGWTILLGIGLPFSAWRAWRWWRRRHPGRGSWRPPDA